MQQHLGFIAFNYSIFYAEIVFEQELVNGDLGIFRGTILLRYQKFFYLLKMFRNRDISIKYFIM